MPLILILYLNHAFEKILPEFEPSGFYNPGPRAQNVKTPDLTFDLTVTSHVTSILSPPQVILARLVESFRMPPRTTLYDHGSRDSRGRDTPPPPPQALKGAPVAQVVTGIAVLCVYRPDIYNGAMNALKARLEISVVTSHSFL